MKALVIDDDDIAREMLCESLRSGGYEVHDLPSPIGASRAILRNNIDAVVLDVMMPNISGDKLARMLRDAAKGNQLTIILVSSRPIHELRELAVTARADGVVPKNRARKDLSPALMRAYRNRHPLRTATR